MNPDDPLPPQGGTSSGSSWPWLADPLGADLAALLAAVRGHRERGMDSGTLRRQVRRHYGIRLSPEQVRALLESSGARPRPRGTGTQLAARRGLRYVLVDLTRAEQQQLVRDLIEHYHRTGCTLLQLRQHAAAAHRVLVSDGWLRDEFRRAAVVRTAAGRRRPAAAVPSALAAVARELYEAGDGVDAVVERLREQHGLRIGGKTVRSLIVQAGGRIRPRGHHPRAKTRARSTRAKVGRRAHAARLRELGDLTEQQRRDLLAALIARRDRGSSVSELISYGARTHRIRLTTAWLYCTLYPHGTQELTETIEQLYLHDRFSLAEIAGWAKTTRNLDMTTSTIAAILTTRRVTLRPD